MSELLRSSPALLVSPDIHTPSKPPIPVALQTCLVVTASPHRAQLWVRAAHEEHWTTVVCTTAEDANRQSIRHRIELALIGLQSAAAECEARFKALVQQLAARGGPLLAVCGKPDDPSGEVWSRQLGIWMYLPGVDGQSDIAMLCGEARNILEKLGDRTGNVHT
jgi:hypothetical protein